MEDTKKKKNLLHSVWALVIAVLLLGPLALPLLWSNPAYSRASKIVWSALIVAITVGAFFSSAYLTNLALESMQAG